MNAFIASSMIDMPRTSGNRIPVVPRTFKTPQGGQLDGVMGLLESGSVDEVVVVISARIKRLHSSSMQAIDANASELMWLAMLGDESRVRIEMSANNAAEHVRKRMSNVPAGTRMLLCVAEDDAQANETRPLGIEEKIQAEIEACANIWRLPTGSSKADPSLPNNNLSPMAARLVALHGDVGISPEARLSRADSTSQCLEFDTVTTDGTPVRLKYIGDETGEKPAGKRQHTYPSNRLASAHRCLRWLEQQHSDAEWFPRVHFFDESRRLLAEKKPLADGHTLLSEFIDGKFDVDTAARLGKIVASLHSTPATQNPLRGSWRAEKAWWKQRLGYWQERLDITGSECSFDPSGEAGSGSLVHLNLAAENVMLCDGQVALRAFECASSIGDPMLDVLVVLSNYLSSGVATGRRRAAERAAESFAASYREYAPQGADCVRRAWQLVQTGEKKGAESCGVHSLCSSFVAQSGKPFSGDISDKQSSNRQ